MEHTMKTKRPKKDAAKSTVMKAIKGLNLNERVEVMAAALASMGLPTIASMLREAAAETLK